MYYDFIILCAQTVISWFLVVWFYRKKTKYTLIPLYSYIAVLTVFTHNLSDLGFAVIVEEWFFLIASFAFFTTLMLATLYLYLFEGPRAGRLAIWDILLTSFFYIITVYLLGLETNTASWIQLDATRMMYYFWSLLAIVADVVVLAILWELLARFKKLPLVGRVFIVMFAVYVVDTIIFVSGAFGSQEFYFSMLKSNLIIRLVLSVIGAPIMAYFLKAEGFAESNREKPKRFWEILNFRSDLEVQITELEDVIKQQKILEQKLRESEETYQLVVHGSGAIIWDWNVLTNQLTWSSKFYELMGYSPAEFKSTLDEFKRILHPEDLNRTFDIVNKCFADGKSYETEYRLKNSEGNYVWFLASGITKYDNKNKPVRMVGTLINISARKAAELDLKNKVEELENINKLMVGRELEMMKLKERLSALNR